MARDVPNATDQQVTTREEVSVASAPEDSSFDYLLQVKQVLSKSLEATKDRVTVLESMKQGLELKVKEREGCSNKVKDALLSLTKFVKEETATNLGRGAIYGACDRQSNEFVTNTLANAKAYIEQSAGTSVTAQKLEKLVADLEKTQELMKEQEKAIADVEKNRERMREKEKENAATANGHGVKRPKDESSEDEVVVPRPKRARK